MFSKLLKQISDAKKKKGGDYGETEKIEIEAPILGKLGTRKVVWTNFAKNCNTINRY